MYEFVSTDYRSQTKSDLRKNMTRLVYEYDIYGVIRVWRWQRLLTTAEHSDKRPFETNSEYVSQFPVFFCLNYFLLQNDDKENLRLNLLKLKDNI